MENSSPRFYLLINLTHSSTIPQPPTTIDRIPLGFVSIAQHDSPELRHIKGSILSHILLHRAGKKISQYGYFFTRGAD
jgi:hypothetical protein